ncbi:MAG TPA: ROK family transcriptional regulator [Propionibacteriaceae bacterium]
MTESALPSLDLVRQVTDRHVLDQLLGRDELTRAEIAARTGISKPTISESVRRLVAAGLVAEAGRQVGKRGPSGTYYRLRPDLGLALAVVTGPAGVVVEAHDLHGGLVRRVEREIKAPIDTAHLGPVITEAVTEAIDNSGRVRGCAVSLAGPVDQATGRLVRLAYSPFLLDELDPRVLLADLVAAPVEVDNDVNWAALAEHDHGSATDLRHFCYLYLGTGLGAAVMVEGAVVHGGGGLAGEIAHVRTVGPGGGSLTLQQCFEAWQLVIPGTVAVDLDRVSAVLVGATLADRQLRDEIVEAVAGVIGSMTALLNPQAVLIGGPWGSRHQFSERVSERVRAHGGLPTEIRAVGLGDVAPLAGARIRALQTAQESLTASL